MPPGSDARLLVVDDIPENRDLLVRRLQRLGHSSIGTAGDGEEALARLLQAYGEGAPYDVVLLDVMMPRMSGIEVLQAMRGHAGLADTPVIMISAATEIDTVVKCVELGAEDYLAKPFNAVLLRARLGTVLEKKRLRDALARQLDRLEQELADARRQQLSMVPDVFPEPDPAHPVQVHAVMHPAREVGGDLYDCFLVTPGMLCVAVGDVAGKGMPAALFMARARSLLRASALQHAAATGLPPRPSELMAVMNEELCKNNPGCMFVTLFVGFLECATGTLTYGNAGHVLPWLLRSGALPAEIRARPGPPLGIVERARHADQSMTLERGDALVVITDGLPEMMDADGSFYTMARVTEDLAGLTASPPDVICQTLARNVLAFAGTAAPADDVTALALRRLH